MQGEVGHALNDPNYALNIAVGPPFVDLKAQPPGSGLIVANQVDATQPRRFVLKKAHMSNEDYRIFDAVESKRVVAVMHHFGKNPYGELDPLGMSHTAQVHESRIGEWESLGEITGYQGMPQLRVRCKAMSMHGRQFVQSKDGRTTFFSISKESRLKNMAIRPNLVVCKGETDEVMYQIHPDMMGRTFQVVTPKEELVCFVCKTTTALLLDVALGAGSEMMIDVAPGVDWTAMLAIVLAIYQVGEHWAKDALGNFVIDPAKDSAVSSALDVTGLQGVASMLGGNLDKGMRMAKKAQEISKLFK